MAWFWMLVLAEQTFTYTRTGEGGMSGQRDEASGYDADTPLAICLAALKAVSQGSSMDNEHVERVGGRTVLSNTGDCSLRHA